MNGGQQNNIYNPTSLHEIKMGMVLSANGVNQLWVIKHISFTIYHTNCNTRSTLQFTASSHTALLVYRGLAVYPKVNQGDEKRGYQTQAWRRLNVRRVLSLGLLLEPPPPDLLLLDLLPLREDFPDLELLLDDLLLPPLLQM